MAIRALLYLHLSTFPNGAVIAGWHPGWEYSWPRDSSWVAVAFAFTGHTGDAFSILRFLQQAQLSTGTWAARYWPDGSGPVKDGRPGELDANGWVPWAVWSWSIAEREGGYNVERQLAELWPMIRAAANATVRSLSSSTACPSSLDGLLGGAAQVTLGIAAPLLTGLRCAAEIADDLGYKTSASYWARAAASLTDGIGAGFGRYGYHRLPHRSSGADSAITFLGLPVCLIPVQLWSVL